jgi:hypothetical protein
MNDMAMKGASTAGAEVDCGAKRNRYFRAKRMRAEDFALEQLYGVERRRLVNRAVLGSGVVYGFALPAPKPQPAPPPKDEGDHVPVEVKEKEPPKEEVGVVDAPQALAVNEIVRVVHPEPDEDPAHERTRVAEAAAEGWGEPAQPEAEAEDAGDEAAAVVEGAEPLEPAVPAKPPEAPETAVILTVGPGFALDDKGRELLRTNDAPLSAANTFFMVPTNGGWRAQDIGAFDGGEYLLRAHYAERPVSLVRGSDDCGCGPDQANYLCETVVFSLTRLRMRETTDGPERAHCPCGDRACPGGPECAGDCCGAGSRGPHARLCGWTVEVPEPAAACLPRWHGLEVALADGVPIGCVKLSPHKTECDPIGVYPRQSVACCPRPIVKNNELLYDLIRGCDLTRVSKISWADWHRTPRWVSWRAFQHAFGREGEGFTHFVVAFTSPVMIESLWRPQAVTMTITIYDPGTGWGRTLRVPITDLIPRYAPDLPPGETREVRIAIETDWQDDEIFGGHTTLSDGDFFDVEIEIRGDLIVDCSGQQVDATTPGLASAPSGNGTPGGTYLSCFRVQAKPRREELHRQQQGRGGRRR